MTDLKPMAYKVAGSWLAQILKRESERWSDHSPGEDMLLEHVAQLATDLCQGLIIPAELEDAEIEEAAANIIDSPEILVSSEPVPPGEYAAARLFSVAEVNKLKDLVTVGLQHANQLRTITSNRSGSDLCHILLAIGNLLAIKRG